MTHKTGQMSMHPCGVNIFKTLTLWDCWADVSETRCLYILWSGDKSSSKWNFEFWPMCHVGEM